jgi:exosome complex exonuclease RRP6
LLYIYDRLRNELLEKGEEKVKNVFERSREICLSRYEKEITTETSFLSLLNNKSDPITLNEKQTIVFKQIYKWRDQVAREEDESVKYVLPNHMLRSIAETIPKTIKEMLDLCSPIPHYLRRDRAKLMTIINQSINRETKEEEEDREEEKEEVSELLKEPNENEKTENKPSSPVLSTEELYQNLGWVSQTKKTNLDFNFDFVDTIAEKPKNIKVHKKTNSLFSFDEEIEKDFDKNIYFDIFKKKENLLEKDEFLNSFKEEEKEKVEEKKSKKRNNIEVDEDDIPKSLNDIYKLSKLNRQQKVHKKKSENLEENDFQIKNKEENVSLSKPIDFMKKIGWINNENEKNIENMINQKEDEEIEDNESIKKKKSVTNNVYNYIENSNSKSLFNFRK